MTDVKYFLLYAADQINKVNLTVVGYISAVKLEIIANDAEMNIFPNKTKAVTMSSFTVECIKSVYLCFAQFVISYVELVFFKCKYRRNV